MQCIQTNIQRKIGTQANIQAMIASDVDSYNTRPNKSIQEIQEIQGIQGKQTNIQMK